MKHSAYLTQVLFILTIVISLLACNKEEEEEELVGNWVKLSAYEGVARSNAVGFLIGNKAYVGTGYDGSDRLNDFWEYDAEKNTWVPKADFPGTPRNGAVAFGIGTKGYVGTGYDGMNYLNDFWEYNSETDEWTRKADFVGSPRYGAVGFSIDDKGYIGTGFDGNYLKDFYEYDPANDTWTRKTSVEGNKRQSAAAFVINGKGYICTGIDNGSYVDDFLEYDPSTDKWTKKRSISDKISDESFDDDYTTIMGINKASFVVNGKGYLVAGGFNSVSQDVWEYDPITDLWEEKTSLEGSYRTSAVGFSIGNRGYITTGRGSSYYFDDLWAFDPDDEYNEDD